MAANPTKVVVTFLGCGKLSSAILEGILASLSDHALRFAAPPHGSNISHPTPIQPSAFIACVHHEESAGKLRDQFAKTNPEVKVYANENVRGVKEGAVVILGVEPSVYESVLAEEGMRDALSGKILVSFVGGVSILKLKTAIYGPNALTDAAGEAQKQCQIIRVTPSIASAVRDSYTLIIEENEEHYPPSTIDPVYSLFLRVGSVKIWPASSSSAGATLSASSPAFFALGMEGAVKGAVELGIDRKQALEMAAAAMRGAAALVASGESPEEVRKKVATPGGSTERGLQLLEQRGDLVNVMGDAIKVAAGRVDGMGETRSKD
ncbi:delta 1-pyrroline-5-carboxylate reductase [Lecanora helva]